jgi:para-nitrobenzyl esterase
MEYIILIFCTCVVSVCSFLLDNVTQQQQHVVNTHCGPVRGTHSTAYVFKGIPYALPPTKQRRWKPPEPLRRNTNTCWSGTFNASMFGNTCFQFSSDNSSGLIGSEDGLFLNVWTPTLDKNANLPVMV